MAGTLCRLLPGIRCLRWGSRWDPHVWWGVMKGCVWGSGGLEELKSHLGLGEVPDFLPL